MRVPSFVNTKRNREELVGVLLETRKFLERPGNNFDWSPWDDAVGALKEIDRRIAQLRAKELPERIDLVVLFAPTGPVQEVSLSSGWGDEFLTLANRADSAILAVYGPGPQEIARHRAEIANYTNQMFGGGLRWFATILAILSLGYFAFLKITGVTTEVYFPIRLSGESVTWVLAASVAVWTIIALINWHYWRKRGR